MSSISRRNFLAAGITLAAAPAYAQSPNAPSSIDDFFRDFTADWVLHDPDLATSSRYFSGDEQDRFERQLTPQTLAWRRDRIQRAHQGLPGSATSTAHRSPRLSESRRTSWNGN